MERGRVSLHDEFIRYSSRMKIEGASILTNGAVFLVGAEPGYVAVRLGDPRTGRQDNRTFTSLGNIDFMGHPFERMA